MQEEGWGAREERRNRGVKPFSYLARTSTGAYVYHSGLRVRPLNTVVSNNFSVEDCISLEAQSVEGTRGLPPPEKGHLGAP